MDGKRETEIKRVIVRLNMDISKGNPRVIHLFLKANVLLLVTHPQGVVVFEPESLLVGVGKMEEDSDLKEPKSEIHLSSIKQMEKEAMTDTLLGSLVQQLFNSLIAHTNVPPEIQTQFDQLAMNLVPLKSILRDAYKLVEHRKQLFKSLWVNLRELIYAADDILLDCRIRYNYRTNATMMQWYSPSEALFRNQMGSKLKELNMQFNQMEKHLSIYLVPMMINFNNREESNHNKRWTTPIYNQSKIVGLSEDTKKIKRWILPQSKELQRVGIVGMGGLGKTTLTQKIFNDIEVKTRFEKRIWVSVSQTFTATKIMKSMLEQLTKVENDCNSEGMLLEKIYLALMNKSYLIVMDDVWNTENGFGWWEQISKGLPKEEKYSCSIIITTRNEEVAKTMGVVKGKIHRLETLDENDSWALFCKFAFRSSNGICEDRMFETVGKQIVYKCDGLPLAIKMIGALLSTKRRSISEWEDIHNNSYDWLVNDGSVIASLQLSYDELSVELKHCMLCFSIYPEDFEISAEQLVHWWVGEGFVCGNERRTATQKAIDCLSELFSKCLVEVVHCRGYDGRIIRCKMNDVLRKMIIKIAKEEAFCSFSDRNVQQFDAESRHLGFLSEMDTQSQKINSKLRALLLMTNYPFRFSKNSDLAKLYSLRVLDISLCKLGSVYFEDLLDWIKSQRRLAYLNLSGVAGLKEVPDSIGKLQNLQILILTECRNLEKLSSNVTTLQNLAVLDIGNCPSLQNLPHGLGKLSNLQELSGFKLPSQGAEGCRLGDLKSLTNLRTLRINIGEENDIRDEELTVLSHLRHLKVLSIDSKDCKNEAIMKQFDQLSPPQCLEELYLRYYHGHIIPSWITPSNLPRLQYLCIEDGPELTDMRPSFWVSKQKYWKLRGLCLKFLPRLEVHWKTVQEMIPSIEYVETSHCYMFRNFPFNDDYHCFWRKKDEEEI